MRAFLWGGVVITFSLPALAMDCRPIKEMTKYILTGKHQGILAFSIAYNRFPLIYYLAENGDFTIVAVDSDLNACIIITGQEFGFVWSERA